MSEAPPRPARWRRLLVESFAIVASILLAFAIDAWWDEARERERETVLLRGLLRDFESSRPSLASRAALARRIAINNALFDEGLAPLRGSTVFVPDSLVLAVIGGPTYEATTDVLDAAVASGEIALLRNERLRAELASWRRGLVDTSEDEREVRRITNEEVVPALAGVIDLSPYFHVLLAWGDDGETLDSPGGVTFRPPPELSGLLALRRFYADFAAGDLEDLLATLDRIVTLIEADLSD